MVPYVTCDLERKVSKEERRREKNAKHPKPTRISNDRIAKAGSVWSVCKASGISRQLLGILPQDALSIIPQGLREIISSQLGSGGHHGIECSLCARGSKQRIVG